MVLIARDDEHEPRKTTALYRELVENEEVVAMLGATNSASMLAVTPIVNDSLKVPVICPATDATEITENQAKAKGEDNYLFRVGMYGRGQANFMVDTIVKDFGMKNIGLLTWTGGWGVTGRGELLRRLEELGITPVADETYTSSDTDMTAQILKLREAGAEVILNYGLVRENVFVMQTREQLSDKVPYVSAWGIAGPAFWSATGASGEGVLVSTTATIDGKQNNKRLAFKAEYEKRFNDSMVAPVFAMGAYDAVYLLKEAIERGGTDPKAIRAELEKIPSFEGMVLDLTRPVFSRERHNAVTQDDMIMARWTNGKLLQIYRDDKGSYVEPKEGVRRYLDPKTMALD